MNTMSTAVSSASMEAHAPDFTPATIRPPQARVALGFGTSGIALLDDELFSENAWPVVPPVRLPERRVTQPCFDAHQKWEGRVLDVDTSAFTAIVTDVKGGPDEEEVEFDLEEVSPGDLGLVKPGAIFYWSIGYYTEPSGQRSRSSILVFRRLPAWSTKDLDQARNQAEELRHRLGW